MRGLIVLLFTLLAINSKAQEWPIKTDTCNAIPLGVNFGACQMVLGWAYIDTGCVLISGCGPIGSDGIDYSASFFSSSYACNSACLADTTLNTNCIDSSLMDPSICCIDTYDPVCGCDSITYQNWCVATFYYGIDSYYQGACVTNNINALQGKQFTIYPNPSNGQINIEGIYKETTIGLYNLLGNLVHSQIAEAYATVLNLQNLPRGFYLLTIGNEFCQKIRIE